MTTEPVPPNELHFWGKHAAAFQDVATRELDIEGAVRAGMTTVCLCRELQACLQSPGIHTLLARWTGSGRAAQKVGQTPLRKYAT